MLKNRIEASLIVTLLVTAFSYTIILIASFVFTNYYEFLEDNTIDKIYENILNNKDINDDIEYFIVYVNDNNDIENIVYKTDERLDKKAIQEYINQTDNKENVDMKGYKTKTYEQKNMTIFLNIKDDVETLGLTLQLLIYIFIGVGLFVVAVFSIFSSIFLRPFYRNTQKQKEFITNASHDLKTPLAIISANAEVLQMTMDDNEWINNIINETKDMNKLIDNLLTLAKSDEVGKKLPKCIFNISDLVNDTVHSFEERYLKKRINVDINVNDINYNGNEFETRQLISLLLDNAIKYSPENGNIKIDVKEKKQKIYINFFNTTENNNINVKKIFNRFYRTKKNTRSEGHGIGLSVAQTIVDRNNGSIKAELIDGGIVFKIILPNRRKIKLFHKN